MTREGLNVGVGFRKRTDGTGRHTRFVEGAEV
jgi:hypothetical protein